MATKQAATADAAPADQDGDTTLLDTNAVAVKRLIARGRERAEQFRWARCVERLLAAMRR